MYFSCNSLIGVYVFVIMSAVRSTFRGVRAAIYMYVDNQTYLKTYLFLSTGKFS